ncbi:MAG: hypothetical protein J3K34DRAFT_517811 [Monoraphidium minutum]|nr:MAG: hypothetical protein J3K34DRAFT_517811 [Monoraphidium minutum]
MADMPGRSGFICICPQKAVCLGADRHLHRDEHKEQLHAELNQTAEADASDPNVHNTYAFLSGGGVRAINPGPALTLAESENCFVICKGHLGNRPDLIERVGGAEASSDAELLRLMYAKYGVDMLGRLEGQFAFCLYDSKQARVLAARDPSGSFGLVEGRTPAGSLLICCGTFLPDGAHDVTKIHPGQYKYGWHALPRPYLMGPTQQVGRVSLDHGIRRRSIDAHRDLVPGGAPAGGGGGGAAAAAAAAQARHSFDAGLLRRSFDAHGGRGGGGGRGFGAAARGGGAGGGGAALAQASQQHAAAVQQSQQHHHPHGGRHGGGPHERQRRASSPGARPQRSPAPAAPAAAPAAAGAPSDAAAAPRAPKPRRARAPRDGRRHSYGGGPSGGGAGSDGESAGSSGSRGTHDSAASGGRKPTTPAAAAATKAAAGSPARPAAGSGRGGAAAAAGACERAPAVAPDGAAMIASAMQGLAC